MKLRQLFCRAAFAAFLMGGLGIGGAQAATYTLTITGFDLGSGPIESASASLTLPGFITSDLVNQPWDSCTMTGGFTCTIATFDVAPNTFGGNDDFIDFKYESPSSGGGGFLFFQAGAMGTPGVYSTVGFPQDTPGFGNFGEGLLTVTAEAVPVPAALPLFIGGLGVIGFMARRRKQNSAAV
jgi:hypothetical protein